jgi:pimeloyl-ACP methyl ester carboxylesterase
VGLGQVVDNPREEEIGLRFVRERAREHGDEQALRELADLKPPYLENPKQMLVERKWLARYGGDFHTGVSLPLLSDFDARWVWAALRSPEYSWGDLIRFELGFSQVRWALFREFKQLSLLRSVPRLEVPVYLLVGRYDYTTPFELVQEYFDRLDAPLGKHLVWFENSAHSPVLEEPERFAQVLIEQVLPEARAAR